MEKRKTVGAAASVVGVLIAQWILPRSVYDVADLYQLGVRWWPKWGWAVNLIDVVSILLLAIAAYLLFSDNIEALRNKTCQLSLREAARQAYVATKDTLYGAMARSEGDDQKLLNWYAINLAASRGLSLYGKHSVTKKRELVSWKEANFSDIADGGTVIKDAYTSRILYTDLSVRRRDFAEALGELKRLSGR